ncbi:ABC transporter permease [Microbacterium mitrae]|uniref:ABC transporter permease n=1 Tax=Microbacterium mitrae TaxID=664640 RepID=A0A5C8HMR9_9MICO|nr:ABC transporter permease [Microbacterium mitrae]TXK04828.1 ABC transporter permease [Microbacterium mitrae]
MTSSTTAIAPEAATTPPSTPPAPRVRRHRKSGSDIALTVWGVAVMIFLFLPIIVIVISSFNSGRLLVAWDSFGWDAYLTIFEKPAIQRAVVVSLQVALISAIIATVLGTTAGIAMARHPGRWVGPFLVLLLLVSVTPEIVDAVSLLPWFVTLGQDLGIGVFNDGIVRLSVGSSLFATAVVAYLVRSRLIGQDAKLEEASSDLFAKPMTTFRRITLSLAMPAILAGFLLAFTLSLDNTVIAAFVNVSGTTPWPVYVLSAVRSGLRPEIAAVSTIMLLLTLLALALVAVVLKRAGDSATDIARAMGGN